ncbi:MAG: O-antigen ligase family protein [Clostridiaceae bacterium]|nr:O-antigen ligase family protein [Clostridiaceae bacterium]
MNMLDRRAAANISLKSSELELLLLLFPFFVPQYVMNLGAVSSMIELYKLGVLFFVVINISRKDSDLPVAFYLVMVFKGLDVIPLLLGNAFAFRTLYLWFKDFYSVVLLCYIIFLACKRDYYSTVQKLYWILSVWIILHVLCFYATGIELLGIRTKISHSFIVCLTLCLITQELGGTRFKWYDYVFLGLSLYYIVDRRISTVMIASAALLIGYFLAYFAFAHRIINYTFMVSAGIVLNLSILFLRIQNYFRWLIVDLLNEDLSLNKRTYIWDDVLRQCREKMWLGHGIIGENRRTVQVNIVNPDAGMNLVSPIQVHNQLLSILYFNGVIGLGVFYAMLLTAGARLKTCRNKRDVILLVFGMTALILAAIAELSCENFGFYALLMCVALCDYANGRSPISGNGRTE